jgi:hypothetical protein
MKYQVKVSRTSFIFGTVTVEADNPSQAEKAVQEIVQDQYFKPVDEDEMLEDWETGEITPVEEEEFKPISIPEKADGLEELDFG